MLEVEKSAWPRWTSGAEVLLLAAGIIAASLLLGGSEAFAGPTVRIRCTDGHPIARVRVQGRETRAALCDGALDGSCLFNLQVYCARALLGDCPPLITPVPVNRQRRVRFFRRSHVLRCTSPPRCPVCGDGACEQDEGPCNCARDCGPGPCLAVLSLCGNGRCELGYDPPERHETCPGDCPLLCRPR